MHIPKTGGTSVEHWANARHLSLKTVHETRCATLATSTCGSFFYGNSSHCGSTSKKHCVTAAAAAHADPSETTFCTVRDVVSRAVSTFNYRVGKQDCSTGVQRNKLNRWLWDVYLHGKRGVADVDNHDRPQVEFAAFCDHVLCFDRLAQDFAHLTRDARLLPGRSGEPLSRPADTFWRRPSNHTRVSTFFNLPQIRQISSVRQSTCTTAHLTPKVRGALLRAFANDTALYERTCM